MHAMGSKGNRTTYLTPFLSSTTSTRDNAILSCAALPWLCVKDDFRNHLMDAWLIAQSAVPFRMFATTYKLDPTTIIPSIQKQGS